MSQESGKIEKEEKEEKEISKELEGLRSHESTEMLKTEPASSSGRRSSGNQQKRESFEKRRLIKRSSMGDEILDNFEEDEDEISRFSITRERKLDQEKRIIRLYLSSPSEGMEEEKEFLFQKVFPKLQHIVSF